MKKTITIFLVLYSFMLKAQCPTHCPFNLTSKRTEEKILIEWEVLSEVGAIAYHVDRSTDGVTFKTVGVVKSENKNQYEFTDTFTLRAYYRVVKKYQSRTEKTAVMFVDAFTKRMLVYPNPALLGTRVTILGERPVRIYNMLGNLVRELKEEMYIDDLPKGMYIIKSENQTARLLIQ